MNKMKFSIIFILTLIIFCCGQVYGAPSRIYPNNYELTIKNLSKEDVKTIEVLYTTQIGLNFEDEDYIKVESELEKNKLDQNLIYSLIKPIDYEWVNEIDGEWISGKALGYGSNYNHVIKCVIYKDVNKPVFKNGSVKITIKNINKNQIADFFVRITKKDDSIRYSNSFTLDNIVDEYSSEKEIKAAKSTASKTALFETDFLSKEKVLGVTNITKENVKDSNIMPAIVAVTTIIVVISAYIFIKKKKPTTK